MKKNSSMILIISILLLLCSCSGNRTESFPETGEEKVQEESPIIWSDPEYLELADVMKEASEKHRNDQLNNEELDNAAKDLETHQQDYEVLTGAELNLLLTEHEEATAISIDEALTDVEILFRLLKYGYGAYYYFGGDDSFYPIRDEIIEKIRQSDKEQVSYEFLAELISEELLKVIWDHHFTIDQFHVIQYHPELITKYYYDNSQRFSKDSKGFYKRSSDNEKYYLEGFEKSDATIEPTLFEDGRIAYSPVQLVKAGDHVDKELIRLKSEDGKEISEEINWTLSHAYEERFSFMEPKTEYVENDDYTYVAIRAFPGVSQEIQDNFVDKAKSASSSKLVIMDIRSNNGGTDKPGEHWVYRFSGTQPLTNRLSTVRHTLINSNYYSGFVSSREYGNTIDNDTPVIVLVDDMCGSSGESFLNDLKCMDNTIVVGSNSAGAQICGNQKSFYLPASGINVRFGTSINHTYDTSNVEYVGYRPDLWCNPRTSIDCIAKMLNINIEEGHPEDIIENVGGDQRPDEPGRQEDHVPTLEEISSMINDELGKIELHNDNLMIEEGENQLKNIDDSFLMMRNGSLLANHEVEIGVVSEGMTIEKEKGKIHIVCGDKPPYYFEIIYKDESHYYIFSE